MVFPPGELGGCGIKFKPEHEMFSEFIRETMGFDSMGT
jgi:hypothetical protein